MTHSPLARLGLDTYSLRAQNWDAFQQLEYCAARGVTVVHFSEPRLVGGFDRAHLQRVRARADALGLEIEIGMLSICPTSGIFDPSTARRFLHSILERGGSRDAMDAFVEFRGRKPELEPLLRQMGLAA